MKARFEKRWRARRLRKLYIWWKRGSDAHTRWVGIAWMNEHIGRSAWGGQMGAHRMIKAGKGSLAGWEEGMNRTKELYES